MASAPYLAPAVVSGWTVMPNEHGAAWRFDVDPVQLSGTAESFELEQIPWLTSEGVDSYLVANVSGGSMLRLCFTNFDLMPWEHDAELTIAAQRSARDMLPRQGEARMDIDLDGVSLWREGLVMHSELRMERVFVPSMLLEAGDHEIRVRLSPSSRAPCRIHRIDLHPRP